MGPKTIPLPSMQAKRPDIPAPNSRPPPHGLGGSSAGQQQPREEPPGQPRHAARWPADPSPHGSLSRLAARLASFCAARWTRLRRLSPSLRLRGERRARPPPETRRPSGCQPGAAPERRETRLCASLPQPPSERRARPALGPQTHSRRVPDRAAPSPPLRCSRSLRLFRPGSLNLPRRPRPPPRSWAAAEAPGRCSSSRRRRGRRQPRPRAPSARIWSSGRGQGGGGRFRCPGAPPQSGHFGGRLPRSVEALRPDRRVPRRGGAGAEPPGPGEEPPQPPAEGGVGWEGWRGASACPGRGGWLCWDSGCSCPGRRPRDTVRPGSGRLPAPCRAPRPA